jgi:hypothetical protein
MVLRRMGKDGLTVHGFRSTFSDWCAEQTVFPSEVREMALAELSPAGLGERNQPVSFVVFIRDHFDQTLSLERFDVVGQC